jgi:hypothetical protein
MERELSAKEQDSHYPENMRGPEQEASEPVRPEPMNFIGTSIVDLFDKHS